jgi:hypothetical protein
MTFFPIERTQKILKIIKALDGMESSCPTKRWNKHAPKDLRRNKKEKATDFSAAFSYTGLGNESLKGIEAPFILS